MAEATPFHWLSPENRTLSNLSILKAKAEQQDQAKQSEQRPT
jgi:hypothetical protein